MRLGRLNLHTTCSLLKLSHSSYIDAPQIVAGFLLTSRVLEKLIFDSVLLPFMEEQASFRDAYSSILEVGPSCETWC